MNDIAKSGKRSHRRVRACEDIPVLRLTLLLLVLALVAPAADLEFRQHLIDDDLAGGYQVRVADLNADGQPDVIGLSQRADKLYWYENPSWQRRVIVSGMRQMITLDVADLDGDGAPEIALGTHFGQTDETSEGRVYILTGSAASGAEWRAQEIDRLPTTHRVRFLDFDGDGEAELLNSPLTGPGCRGPLFDCHTPLVYYEPKDWKRRYVTTALDGVVHGMREADWDGPTVLAASMGGVDRFRPDGAGGWVRLRLAESSQSPRPRNGASEVRVGHLSDGRFVTTIEPWHGHQVVVYCCEGRGYFSRSVIDSTLVDGHVLNVADFDGDGEDEILAGVRGAPQRLMVYRRNSEGWARQLVDDGGISAAGCDIADIDGDGDLDFSCIGARTGNVKWYENVSGGATP